MDQNTSKHPGSCMQSRTMFLTQAAIIAALYIILTFLANTFGLANNVIQIRFSESLCILPYFTNAAVPGLFIGCLISNILTGCALPDIIFGSLATLLGSLVTFYICRIPAKFSQPQRALRLRKWNVSTVIRLLIPIGPILSNTLIIPFVLYYAYGIQPLWLSFITVGIGELISCGILGLLLLSALERYRTVLFH